MTGVLLPLKLLGTISDIFILLNKTLFIGSFILVAVILYLSISIPIRKNNDLISVLNDIKPIQKVPDKTYIINKKLKEMNFSCHVEIFSYGRFFNRYKVVNYTGKIQRLRSCIETFLNGNIVISETGIFVDVGDNNMIPNNHTSLKEYLGIIQWDSIVLLDNFSKVLTIYNKYHLFIHESVPIYSICGLLLLSLKCGIIIFVNIGNVNITSVTHMNMNDFLMFFDRECNKNFHKQTFDRSKFVFIKCDDKKIATYLLKYGSKCGFVFLFIGETNSYGIIQELYMHKYVCKSFEKTILLPVVPNDEFFRLALFFSVNH